MSDSFRNTLAQLLKARFPILMIESHEEERVVAEITAVARDPGRVRTPRAIWMWSLTTGLRQPDELTQATTRKPTDALDAALRLEQPCVVIFRDLHAAYAHPQQPETAPVVRRLRDIASAYRQGPVPRCLVLVSPVAHIPVELEKDISLVDFPLPTEAEIRSVLDGLIAANVSTGRVRIDLDGRGRERFVKAGLGLTLHEAENAFARAIVNDGCLDLGDLPLVHEEKCQAVRRSGMLEFVNPEINLADVGGLENLKLWLSRRTGSWLAEAAAYGLPAPRGVLITGVPGCGKSLTAKAVSAAWELPLLRFDIGRVFAGLVGSSEQNMRAAIRTAEAVAPCVLWVDEIEKGFAGRGSGDSGTSIRVLSTFLTWMQEKTHPVFVIATANDLDGLPPEFLRKGRFDEIFFVDLPTHAERISIWRLHLAKRLTYPALAGEIRLTDDFLNELSAMSDGMSGAEIEQALIGGLFDAYSERRPLRNDDVFRALANVVPLSVTQAEKIEAIRSWATRRAVTATAAEDWDLDRELGRDSGRDANRSPHQPEG